MAKDTYISVGKRVNGFSFANLGLFTGFADGIYNAVYSLVLLEIFKSSATVGLYVALYSVFCFVVGLFANEILRQFSKVRVFYFALLMLAVCYAMMSFSILPRTFIILDYTTGIAITLSAALIPLFMSDFSKNIGMARLNSRYHLWMNVGALFAPTVAVFIANHFDNRAAFFGSALIYFAAWVMFKLFNIVQPDYAFFGEKDAQQLIIIKKMVKDLNIPVEIVSCPIVREESGLALSSRNKYLSEEDKQYALALSKILFNIKSCYENGVTDVKALKETTFSFLTPKHELEYLDFRDENNLEEKKIADDSTRVFIACRVGGVRLIDNILLGD